MTTTPNTPDQPDGIEDDSVDLPDPARAAGRIAAFLSEYGDGIVHVDEDDDLPPLYARDLEALRTAQDRAERERRAHVAHVIDLYRALGLGEDADADEAVAEATQLYDEVLHLRRELAEARANREDHDTEEVRSA